MLYRHDNLECAQLLIEADKDCVNYTDFMWRTPLHLSSVYCDDLKMIKLLLENGADVNARYVSSLTMKTDLLIRPTNQKSLRLESSNHSYVFSSASLLKGRQTLDAFTLRSLGRLSRLYDDSGWKWRQTQWMGQEQSNIELELFSLQIWSQTHDLSIVCGYSMHHLSLMSFSFSRWPL